MTQKERLKECKEENCTLQNILKMMNVPLKKISNEMGVSYNTLLQWKNGTRQPNSHYEELLTREVLDLAISHCIEWNVFVTPHLCVFNCDLLASRGYYYNGEELTSDIQRKLKLNCIERVEVMLNENGTIQIFGRNINPN